MMGPTSLAVVTGTIDHLKYIDLLETHLLAHAEAFYGENWRFQQDNARPHTARVTMEWLTQHVPQLIDWPANSADLSPIENMWLLLKNATEKENAHSVAEFRAAVAQTWENSDLDIIRRLIDTMPRRLKACRDGRGEVVNLKLC